MLPHFFVHEEIKLGEHTLDKKLQEAILNLELLEVEPNMFTLPGKLQIDTISKIETPRLELYRNEDDDTRNKSSLSGNCSSETSSLFLGNGTPELPELGDVRLEYWYIPDGVYWMIAQKEGTHLQPFANDSLFIRSDLPCGGSLHVHSGTFALIFSGTPSVSEMFKTTHRENDILFIILRFIGLLLVVIAFLMWGNPLGLLFGWIPFIGLLWEKAVLKLMQVIGTFVACSISIFYFLKYNSFANLTIYDFYFGVAALLFIFFVHNLSVSVSSGGDI